MSEVALETTTSRRETWICRGLAAVLVLAAAGLHVAYLAHDCSLDLSPDEAHYWLWSRNLDWSYYSKGPLVAYLIRLGTAVAGNASIMLTDNLMVAVRLPAIVCGSLLLVSLYVLTVQVYRREWLALGVVGLALTLPVIAVGASIMTIDAPYTCCWGWALVVGHHACFRRSAWAWPVCGLLIGLGILAKYTMVAWIPSLGLFLLFDGERRRLLLRPGFWMMTATAILCCLPIVVWNAEHDWVSLRHVSVQAGAGQGIRWLGPLRFLATQFGLLLGFWFVGWLRAMIVHRPWKETDPGVRYLWWTSGPMFAMFLLFSLRTNGGEPNWPVTAYVSGLVLMTAELAKELQAPQAYRRRFGFMVTGLAACLGIALTLLLFFSTKVQPLLARLSGPATPQNPMPLRRFDPTCRLRGWRYLAGEVDALRRQIRDEEGEEPIIAANNWMIPGELAFYCEGNPRLMVYSVGLALGDRQSQFDLWRPNPVLDPERFQGKTFLLVGNPQPKLSQAFQRGGIGAAHPVVYTENGQPIACWQVLVCRGFKKFDELPRWIHH